MILFYLHLKVNARFNVNDVRVFSGRTSMGVRGIKLQKNDRIISSSILNSIEINTDEREEYIKYSNSLRRNDKKYGYKKERIEILYF